MIFQLPLHPELFLGHGQHRFGGPQGDRVARAPGPDLLGGDLWQHHGDRRRPHDQEDARRHQPLHRQPGLGRSHPGHGRPALLGDVRGLRRLDLWQNMVKKLRRFFVKPQENRIETQMRDP